MTTIHAGLADELQHDFSRARAQLATARRQQAEKDTPATRAAVAAAALDAGADDFVSDDGVFEISTDPDAFHAVRDALDEKGYSFATCEIQLVPQNYISLADEHDILMMDKLIEALEDNDDVQNIYHNWENVQ